MSQSFTHVYRHEYARRMGEIDSEETTKIWVDKVHSTATLLSLSDQKSHE